MRRPRPTARRDGQVPGGRRLVVLGGALAVAAVLVAAALSHAAYLRARWRSEAPRRAAAARVTGTTDLALSSTSRWLRHPSQSEPFAPFADGPAVLGPDPAGGLLAPPRAAFDSRAARDVRIRRGSVAGEARGGPR